MRSLTAFRDWTVSRDGYTLTVYWFPAHGQATVSVEEDDREVRITLREPTRESHKRDQIAKGFDGSVATAFPGDCSVRLYAPLGERRVVDGATGIARPKREMRRHSRPSGVEVAAPTTTESPFLGGVSFGSATGYGYVALGLTPRAAGEPRQTLAFTDAHSRWIIGMVLSTKQRHSLGSALLSAGAEQVALSTVDGARATVSVDGSKIVIATPDEEFRFDLDQNRRRLGEALSTVVTPEFWNASRVSWD